MFENLKIVNGTQHEIVFYREEDTVPVQEGRKLVLREGAEPVFQVPPGRNLNARKGNAAIPSALEGIEFPFRVGGAVVFVDHDPVPEGADIVIVSALYRNAVEALGGDTSRLATVDGTVYRSESDLRPCGTLGLAIG